MTEMKCKKCTFISKINNRYQLTKHINKIHNIYGVDSLLLKVYFEPINPIFKKPTILKTTINKVLKAYSKFIDEAHSEGMTLDEFSDKDIVLDIFERLNK